MSAPRIERVTVVTDELVEAIGQLLPQLDDIPAPTRAQVETVVASPGNVLLVARDEAGWICGTATVAIHRKLLGPVGWLEDVVVDESRRGRGYGEALVRAAEREAGAAGMTAMRLTSREFRAGAHRLYERLGYERHQTRVYRKRLA